MEFVTSTAPAIAHDAVSETSTEWMPARSESSQNRAVPLRTSDPAYVQPAGRDAMQGSRVALGTDCAMSTNSSPSSTGQFASDASPAWELHAASAEPRSAIASTAPARRGHLMRTRSSC